MVGTGKPILMIATGKYVAMVGQGNRFGIVASFHMLKHYGF